MTLWPRSGGDVREAWLELEVPIEDFVVAPEMQALALHRRNPTLWALRRPRTYVYALLVPRLMGRKVSGRSLEGLGIAALRPGQRTFLPVAALARVTITRFYPPPGSTDGRPVGGEPWNLAAALGLAPVVEAPANPAVELPATRLSPEQLSHVDNQGPGADWASRPLFAVTRTHPTLLFAYGHQPDAGRGEQVWSADPFATPPAIGDYILVTLRPDGIPAPRPFAPGQVGTELGGQELAGAFRVIEWSNRRARVQWISNVDFLYRDEVDAAGFSMPDRLTEEMARRAGLLSVGVETMRQVPATVEYQPSYAMVPLEAGQAPLDSVRAWLAAQGRFIVASLDMPEPRDGTVVVVFPSGVGHARRGSGLKCGCTNRM